MAILKWLGFLLVAVAVAVLPFTIWISNSWGLVFAATGFAGCVLLAIAFSRRPMKLGDEDPNLGLSPQKTSEELRGFPGAKAFDHPGDGPADGDGGP